MGKSIGDSLEGLAAESACLPACLATVASLPNRGKIATSDYIDNLLTRFIVGGF